MVYRSIVSVKPNGTVEVYHQDGEVVEVRDKNEQSGIGAYVRIAGSWLYKLTGEWRTTRWESFLRAAEELERIADGVIDQASVLRHQAAQEQHAAPGVRGSAQAPGSPQPADGTSPAVVDAALDLPAGGGR
jgi:hypothetical protein